MTVKSNGNTIASFYRDSTDPFPVLALPDASSRVYANYFYAYSDKRLKDNIKTFVPHRSILDLPIVEFDWKNSGVHSIGCLAQDLQEICPELVSETADGYLTVEDSKLVYLLIQEVKELKEEVEKLKGE